MGLLKKLSLSRKKTRPGSAATAQDELASWPGSVGSVPQNSTLKQSVLHSAAERAAVRPSSSPSVALAALAAQLQHSHAHGATECCCPLLSAAITSVNTDPSTALPRHDVFMIGQEIVFVLQHGRECCRYTAASLMASLTAQQASRTVLHQLYVVPALAHALSVSAVHNARPVAVALGNLALEPITHPALLGTDGLLEGLVGILLWSPSAQELQLVPAEVVDACKHDALYALGALAASPTGAAALLEFDDVVPVCLAAAAGGGTASDMRHAALQLLQRLSSCGGVAARQQVAEADGMRVLCGVLDAGCGGGGRCVLCARGVLGVLGDVALDARSTQRMAEGGGVAAIRRCLGHADGAVQRDAAVVLSRLAAHEGCRGGLLSDPQLVASLQNAIANPCDDDAVGPLLGAAAALAVVPAVKRALVAGGVVATVVGRLHDPSPGVRGQAACLLAALATEPGAARAMVDAGALFPLVLCLHSPEEGPSWGPAAASCGARGGALLALGAMAEDDDVAARLLHMEGAVDGAMQLVAHSQTEVSLGALALLCALVSQSRDHGCFVRAWSFPQVLPCLEHPDADCREQARAFVTMLAVDDQAASRLVSANVLPMVGRCLVADTHVVARLQYLDLLGILVLGGHARGDAHSVTSGCSVATPTQRKVLDAGRQLAAVKGLAPALLQLLGGMLGGEGEWARINAALEVLQSMARTHRAALTVPASRDLAVLAQLLHSGTPDAPRFATIKLLTALAKHKDPAISQALVSAGLIAALVEELRLQQALAIAGSPPDRDQRASADEGGLPSSPTSGVMVCTPFSDSPASKETAEGASPASAGVDAGDASHSFAFPSPPHALPDAPASPPRDHPATLRDLHLLAVASAAPSDAASMAGDHSSLTASTGRRRSSVGAWNSGVQVCEEPPAFWQHCLLVALYNVCLDDDACQEVFLDHGSAALLCECLAQRIPNSDLCVANFVAALAVDCPPQQAALCAHGLEDALCALYARSLEQQQLRNVIAVALWELWGHAAPASLSHGVALDELLARKDDVLRAC